MKEDNKASLRSAKSASFDAGSSIKSGKSGGGKAKFRLDPKLLVKIHDRMLLGRLTEERLIKMYKQNDGFFWIGGPGEEAFNIPLGMQVKKGQGVQNDYLHLHYRSSGILLGMDVLDPIDAFRQMKNVASDPFSGGRNFGNHFSISKYNVVPVSSTIETQYLTAIGTGIAQAREKGKGITIVNGGDAGTAEGDFASCLVWASRPALPLPMLIIVTNNLFGISTSYDGQHGESRISDRAGAFNIKNYYINGNDVEESWFTVKEAMDYIRTERKPAFIEARVSRLYGHSSASGANFVSNENDPLQIFENQLASAGILSPKEMTEKREKITQELIDMSQKARQEPMPDPSTIYDHTYYGQKGRYW